MQMSNSLSAVRGAAAPQKSFSAFVTGNSMQAMLSKACGSPQAAAQVSSTVIRVVSDNPKLRECDWGDIVTAALYGEIGLGLSIALGDYNIIPYLGNTKKSANFQLSAKGITQLAVRSGAYAKIRYGDVREGEFLGRDQSRDPIFRWEPDEEKRLSLPIVGYYAHYKLTPVYGGLENWVYMSHEEILAHANRYSPAFKGKLETYRKLVAGKLDSREVWKLQNGSPWFALPDEKPHIKMCLKTVTKQLLSDGMAPKSVRLAIQADEDAEQGEGSIIPSEYAAAYAETKRLEAAGGYSELPVGETEDAETPQEPVSAPAGERTARKGKPAGTPGIDEQGASRRPTDAEEGTDAFDNFFS